MTGVQTCALPISNLREWLDSSIQAVSGPVFIAALVGLVAWGAVTFVAVKLAIVSAARATGRTA